MYFKNDKRAAIDWDKFRQAIKRNTPVDINETSEEKAKRIKDLEANPEEWKRYYFPNYYKYPSPDFHLKSSAKIRELFYKNKHVYATRHWARGLAKTTVTMADTLYEVMMGKLKFILYTSSTYEAAENFLTKYQCQLDSNDRLINDYGKQENEGFWEAGSFTTRKGAMFLALGAGQSPRGRSNEEIRPDCIIIDDFDTDQECLNIDIINKKWDWFEKALLPTVDISSPYMVIWLGNIIAEDCCVVRAGKISDHCEIVNIRDENNVSVWSAKNSESDIDYILSKLTWAAGQQEYFNNPVREGATFKEMYFKRCPDIKTLPFVVIYADPSVSNKDKPAGKSKNFSSCKSVSVVGSPNNIDFFIYKAFVDVVSQSTFVEWLYEATAYVLANRPTPPWYCAIENNSLQDPIYQGIIKPLIIAEGKKRKFNLPITEDSERKGEKFFRIEATLEPLNRNGHLFLNEEERSNPHMIRMKSQFLAVSPNSKTMDGPDSVQGAVKFIQNKFSTWNPGATIFGQPARNSKRY